MHTADDCSRLCWPAGGGPAPEGHPDHIACEIELTDFSNPAKRWAYCACDCHYVETLPGFAVHTSGRYVTRELAQAAGYDILHPMLISRGDLDLSELRAHCKAMHHRSAAGSPMPRSNYDLTAWHARQHHQLHLGHIHRGAFVLVQQPSDRGRKPVGQIVRPVGNYTGQLPVTREELKAEFRMRQLDKEKP